MQICYCNDNVFEIVIRSEGADYPGAKNDTSCGVFTISVIGIMDKYSILLYSLFFIFFYQQTNIMACFT